MKILSNISKMTTNNTTVDNIDYTILNINENSLVAYRNTDKSNPEVLSDLLENKAYATALLYLNENYELEVGKFKDIFSKFKVQDYFKECESLLKRSIKVIEEKGIPLVSIKGYNIFESDKGILRGNGNKKLLESFDGIDLEDITLQYLRTAEFDSVINGMSQCPECKYIFDTEENTVSREEKYSEPVYDGFDKYHTESHINDVDYIICPNCHYEEKAEDFPDAWVDNIIDAPNAEELVPGISNIEEQESMNEEGTQTTDIASKVDQGEVTPAKSEKKYKDLLISDLDESANNLINKGFLKNSKGQYQRGNFILVKEGDKYFAIRKDLIKEK